MSLALLALFSLALSAEVSTRFEEIDFATGRRHRFDLSYAPVASTAGSTGRLAGDVLTLPSAGPNPAYRNSRFSTIYRARDVVDVTRYPARAVAKLFRLNSSGARATQACTAQFVGPRHLITAGHCIADPNDGQPHSGFELAVQYDAGRTPRGVLRVRRAWMVAAHMRLAKPEDALVTPDRCHDLALLEITEPAGAEVGWLGMRDLEPQKLLADNVVLHRFAYPHVSNAASFAALAAKAPPEEKAEFDAQVAEARLTEPDFSPDNLYYEFGRADEAEGAYVAYRTPYSAPGRSGSALIDSSGAVVALASRGYSGTFYSCRLTANDIGAVQALIARAAR